MSVHNYLILYRETRTNKAQLDKMVETMESAPLIARALFKGDQTAFWKDLEEQLNSLGPPIKDCAALKKVNFLENCKKRFLTTPLNNG